MRAVNLVVLTILAFSLAAQPAFEVASVREHQGPVFRTGPLTVSSPLIRLEGYTIFGLVMDAYQLRDFQLDFGNSVRPELIAGDMYDIVARAPDDGVPHLDDVRAMLRTLLADRFHLQVHREIRERRVYALIRGKKGPLLNSSLTPGSTCTVRSSVASDGRNSEETFTNCPVQRLAERLTNLMVEPVLDETGLTGTYDFRLVAVPEYRTRKGPEPADSSPLTAVSELGLKLTPTKASVEILVIDSVRKASGN